MVLPIGLIARAICEVELAKVKLFQEKGKQMIEARLNFKTNDPGSTDYCGKHRNHRF
jgi:hypothetical protein